jgi:hypothetical protein
LAEGEKPHPANYRGCKHEGGGAEKEVAENTQNYNGESVLFQPHHTGMFLAAAFRGKREEQQQPRTHQDAGLDTMEHRVPADLPQHEQQKTGHPVRAPNINSLSLDKMLEVVVKAVQQIMTKYNGSVLEGAKILAIKNLS